MGSLTEAIAITSLILGVCNLPITLYTLVRVLLKEPVNQQPEVMSRPITGSGYTLGKEPQGDEHITDIPDDDDDDLGAFSERIRL